MNVMKALATTAAVLAALVSPAKAACDDIPKKLRGDGGWLFRINGTWRPVIGELNDFVQNLKSRNVYFTYVVNDDNLNNPRRGLLVIKTGVSLKQADTTGDTSHVKLLRYPISKVAKCDGDYRYFDASVSGLSYDRYHDYGYRTDEDATINRFHIRYATRTGCLNSNDAQPDAYFSGHRASNISQFSFDPKVVRSGQHSQFLALFGVTPAYAAQAVSDRQVEIKRYVADDSGLACVRFSIKIQPGRFVRINDLDRRSPFRADEQSWTWSE
jgi:hypothetical protein